MSGLSSKAFTSATAWPANLEHSAGARRVVVNLSPRNLLDVQFPAEVKGLLDRRQVDPSLLEFEITEAVWNRLSALGCTVAQGHFVSRPVPPDELRARVRERRRMPARRNLGV